MAKNKDTFGFENYRAGGMERLGEAGLLLRAQNFAGSIYLAGRAVEGLLRALVWRSDLEIQQGRKSLDTGHDLRDLLTLVANLGLLKQTAQGQRDELETRVQRVARLWYNNMRFASSKFVESRWRDAREFGAGRAYKTFKQAASAYYDDCSAIIKNCEVLCERTSWKRY